MDIKRAFLIILIAGIAISLFGIFILRVNAVWVNFIVGNIGGTLIGTSLVNLWWYSRKHD